MDMIPYRDFIASDKQDNFWRPAIYKEKKRSKEYKYCDDIICFDMEVCNFYVDPAGNVLSINDIFKRAGYMPEKIEEMFKAYKPGALPYIWQCSINDWVLYGREFSDFMELLKYIRDKMEGAEAHVWIHNIAFEYSFLRELVPFTDKFFTEARKPLKLNYHTIVFRCSYRLTNLSLAKWGEQIGIEKHTGDLDYHALYSPLQELDEKSLEYCEYDLRVMIAGIRNYLREYGHIKEIPLTQTGGPRRDIKNLSKGVPGFIRKVAKCQPKDAEDWKVLHATYNGGLVLCNPDKADYLIQAEDPNKPGYLNVSGDPNKPIAQRSIDRKSAYPAAMLQKYPCTEFTLVNTLPDWEDGNHHICLVEFVNLKAKYDITPLSSSKRIMIQGAEYNDFTWERITNDKKRRLGVKVNNGKIRFAKRFALYITEVDKRLIDMYYKYDEIKIYSHRIALSDWMDKHVLEYMLQLYADKTLLKTGDPVIYLRKKEKLNSIYGMCGTSLIHDDIIEEGWDYHCKGKDDIAIVKELQRLQKFEDNNVLPYSWGIYVTAHQRYALMSTAMRLGIDKCSYGDTDSLKGDYTDEDMKIVEEINKEIIEWTKWRCDQQGIDYNLTCPKDTKGRPQYLGTWENDFEYFCVKYEGAKRYAYMETPTDRTHITVAGVPKAAAICMKSPDDLREGLTFDFFNSHKNMAVYIDGDNPLVTFPDGYKVHNTCGVVIRPTSYVLTLEEEYRQLLKQYISVKQH